MYSVILVSNLLQTSALIEARRHLHYYYCVAKSSWQNIRRAEACVVDEQSRRCVATTKLQELLRPADMNEGKELHHYKQTEAMRECRWSWSGIINFVDMVQQSWSERTICVVVGTRWTKTRQHMNLYDGAEVTLSIHGCSLCQGPAEVPLRRLTDRLTASRAPAL